jgi:GTPase SAR1 family protein
VVGDEGVGKSALITQLFKETFLSVHVHTSEGAVQQKQIKLMDKSISSEELSTIMLNVYDTCSKDDKSSISLFSSLSSILHPFLKLTQLDAAIETFLSRKAASDGLGFLFVYSIRSRTSAEAFFRFKNYITSLTIDGEVYNSFSFFPSSFNSLVADLPCFFG